MANIKKILSKKVLSGKELGQLELTDLAVNFRQALEGVEDPKPLIARDELQSLVNGICDREQWRIYNGYLSIHEWLSIKLNAADAQFQQALLQAQTIFHYLGQAHLAESFSSFVSGLPLILSKEEYALMREKDAGILENEETETGRRAVRNGIALFLEDGRRHSSPSDDASGMWSELKHYSLEAFFPEDEDYSSNVRVVSRARSDLLHSYFYIMGYNTQIRLTGKYFDIPELSVFELPLQEIEVKIDVIDRTFRLISAQVERNASQTPRLKERKQEVLRTFFQPIDYHALSIPEENVEKAKKLFEDFLAFGEARGLFDSLLCTQESLPQEEE